MTEIKRVEFRSRMAADHYPERHAHAQSVIAYSGCDCTANQDNEDEE